MFGSPENLSGRLPLKDIFPADDPRFTVSFVTVPNSIALGDSLSGELQSNDSPSQDSDNKEDKNGERDSFRIRIVEGRNTAIVERGNATDTGMGSDWSSDNASPRKLFFLIHGWAASSFSYAEIIPEIADAGHRVIAIDLPGHGLSYKLSQKDADIHYTAEYLLSVVEYVFDEVMSGYNGPSGARPHTVLIGHSMGGAIAASFASKHPEKVQELYLVAPAGFERTSLMAVASSITKSAAVAGILPRLITRSVVKLLLNMAFGDSSRIAERHIDQYWAPSSDPGYAYAVRGCLQNFDWELGKRLKLASITAATTVIFASKDNLVSEGAARKYADGIQGSTIIEMSGRGHAVTDEDPAAVASVLDLMRK